MAQHDEGCGLRTWLGGGRTDAMFDVGRVTLFEAARARFPGAVEGLEGTTAVAEALAAGKVVIGARLPSARGMIKVDLLVPGAHGVRLVVLHGGKDPSTTHRAGRQLAAAAGLGVTEVGAAGFVDAGPVAPVRWGPEEEAGVAVWMLQDVAPRPYAPPAAERPPPRPSRKACEGCGEAPACRALPAFDLCQLPGTTPAERDRWTELQASTAADALRLAPPASQEVRLQLRALALGAPIVPDSWPRALADVGEDAAALDLEGWDPPLLPWPSRAAFSRHIAAVAVAWGDERRTWLADPGRPPEEDAADALLRLAPPGVQLLVWGHEDRRRVEALAARVDPARGAALRALAARIVDVGKRLRHIAWPHFAGRDLKSVARTATGADPWAGLPHPFDPMRSLHRLLSERVDDPDERDRLLAYCMADAVAVAEVVRVARSLRPG